MKEHVQKTGVRKYAGDDLIELQAEPLRVIQAFFEKCGNCVINGCEVVAAGNKYNVTPGVVSLSGTDADGAQAAKVIPFGGVENVTLPIYLTLTNTVSERVYGDGKVKPIAYNYTATATNVHPEEGITFLEITTTGGKQFVDAIKVTEKLDKVGNGKDVTVTFAEAAERVNITSGEKLSGMFSKVQKWFAGLKTVAFTGKAADLEQDANNRLVTDTEKTAWADKYTKAQTYTRTEVDNKDAAALQAAKEYAAAKVAEIVNSAPGTLDTLQELAKALGNDPNFATSITALIGGKADRVHGHAISEVSNLQNELNGKAAKNGNGAEPFTASALFANKLNESFNRPRHSGIEMLSSELDGIEGAPARYHSALSVLSRYVGFQLATYGAATEDFRFRKQSDAGNWTAWRELWHSGNFNPDNILALKAKVVTEDEAIPDKFCSFQVFRCVKTSVGGTDGYIWAQRWANGNFVTQIFVDADPTNLIAIRTRGNDGVWTSWKKSATQDQLNGKLDATKKLTTQDLNTVLTPGLYYQVLNTNATKVLHYPIDGEAGTLIVTAAAANGEYVNQIFTGYMSNRIFIRNSVGSTSLGRDWVELVNVDQLVKHTETYEPAFKKNGAFNKNFGTAAGTVAQGNHTHEGVMKVRYAAVVSSSGRATHKIGTATVSKTAVGTYKIIHNLFIESPFCQITGMQGLVASGYYNGEPNELYVNVYEGSIKKDGGFSISIYE